jgi:hypothetical protein
MLGMHKPFQDAVDAERKRAMETADAFYGKSGKQPAYATFSEDPDKAAERFDRECKTPFDFDDLIKEFGSTASTRDMTQAGMELMQSQYALFAQMVRDYRLRRRTRLQAQAHGIVRLRALGHKSGQLARLVEATKALIKLQAPPRGS